MRIFPAIFIDPAAGIKKKIVINGADVDAEVKRLLGILHLDHEDQKADPGFYPTDLYDDLCAFTETGELNKETSASPSWVFLETNQRFTGKAVILNCRTRGEWSPIIGRDADDVLAAIEILEPWEILGSEIG